MHRKWITPLIVLIVALLAVGCSSSNNAPEVEEPDTTATRSPATDVDTSPAPATTADTTERVPEPSIAELNEMVQREGLIGDVFYDFDKYDLRPEARERLAKNAEYMSEHPDLAFVIEGHCDERGTEEYNIALGQRRATAALDYLISLGVDRSRFQTISYGESRPFCTESTEACWQRNRRARFVITERR